MSNTKWADHAAEHGLQISYDALYNPLEPIEQAKARRKWQRSQMKGARSEGYAGVYDLFSFGGGK